MSHGGTGGGGGALPAAGAAAGQMSPAPAGTHCVPCTHNCISGIEILDGDASATLTSGAVRQFVNLPGPNVAAATRGHFRDGYLVRHVDRMGRKIRVRVRAQTRYPQSLTLRLVPDGGNITYTPTERGRSDCDESRPTADVTYGAVPWQGDTVTFDNVVSVTAAGGDRFHVEAECDQGHTQQTPPIEVWRRLYLQEVKMRGTPAADSVQACKNEFSRHKIAFAALPAQMMPRVANIGEGTAGRAQKQRFLRAARQAYNRSTSARQKEPYVIAVAYTDHLAVLRSDAPFSGAYTFGMAGVSTKELLLRDGSRPVCLWMDIAEDGDDDDVDWYVSARFIADSAYHSVLPRRYRQFDIPRSRITPTPLPSSSPTYPVSNSRCDRVNIDMSGLIPDSYGTVVGTVRVVFNVVDRFRCGIALSDGNLVCVCTRAFWREIPADQQNETMVHEIGHKLGMVADGTAARCNVDRVPSQYTGRGHRGSHCSTGAGAPAGARYSATESANSTCVMFGSVNGHIQFCPGAHQCAEAVKKVDLRTGWIVFEAGWFEQLCFIF